MELVIATANSHKAREIRAFLSSIAGLELLALSDFSTYQAPEETGATFEENALLKASHAAKTLGKWALSDDSGLVVPALQGAPGIYSARYAGKDATELENRRKLLAEMKSLTGMLRNAYFECALALVSPDGKTKCVHGRCEGTILDQEKGRKGFGYDALFQKHDYALTFGEIDESVKNQISHRGKAFEKMKIYLSSALKDL